MPEALSFDFYRPNPLLIVISGPSGVGKDAVLQALKERHTPFHFVVTATSRGPRPGETDGVDYHFVSKTRFEEMICNDELIEHALVYQDYKGIPRWEVEKALASGEDVILRVDVQGAQKLRKLYPQAILIFLIPSNLDEWYARLRNRKTETDEGLSIRIATASEEVKHIGIFDYVVVNAEDCLDEAVQNVLSIISAEHHRLKYGEALP